MRGAGELEPDERGRPPAGARRPYRFDRHDRGSHVTVYSGLARYEGPNSGLPIAAGQRAEFWIDSGGVAQYSGLSPVSDGFAAWSSERDRRGRRPRGALCLARDDRRRGARRLRPLGADPRLRRDLDPDRSAHGLGALQRRPLGLGAPWGWTWVDDAPWGFAPFHYGRWVYLRNAWCWAPGTYVARPVYAPALVAWVGGPRANVSISIGGGPAVGWFPLAPREVYVPSYRVSPRYVQNINITHVTSATVINNVIATMGRASSRTGASRTRDDGRAGRA